MVLGGLTDTLLNVVSFALVGALLWLYLKKDPSPSSDPAKPAPGNADDLKNKVPDRT